MNGMYVSALNGLLVFIIAMIIVYLRPLEAGLQNNRYFFTNFFTFVPFTSPT